MNNIVNQNTTKREGMLTFHSTEFSKANLSKREEDLLIKIMKKNTKHTPNSPGKSLSLKDLVDQCNKNNSEKKTINTVANTDINTVTNIKTITDKIPVRTGNLMNLESYVLKESLHSIGKK